MTMPARTFDAFLMAAVVMQLSTCVVGCTAASTAIFVLDAAADTIKAVGSCVTMTILLKKQHLCDHAEQEG